MSLSKAKKCLFRVLHVDGETGEVNQRDDICDVNQRVTGVLSHGDQGYVDLWYTGSDVFYRAQCYFWCTSNGGLPGDGSQNLDRELVDDLVHDHICLCNFNPLLIRIIDVLS